MNVTVNEHPYAAATDATLRDVRAACKPDADVLIVNGAVVNDDCAVHEGDTVVLIRRGEQPSHDELEALMAARHTPGVHAKLKRACVGITGLGGLGSSIAIALARSGVGRLVLVDFDVVEPSNLNRQQYFIDQLGMPKAHALVTTLKRINPYIAYEPHVTRLDPDNVPVMFKDVDVLVEAFDRPDMKAMLGSSFKAAYPAKPIVMASGVAGYGDENAIRVREAAKGLYLVGDLETTAQPGTGLMAPRVGIAAHMQANVVLRLIVNAE